MPVTSRKVHFTVGLYVALLYGFIYTPRIGLCLAIALALLKEHEDQIFYGSFDWHNTVISSFGALTGFLIVTICAYF